MQLTPTLPSPLATAAALKRPSSDGAYTSEDPIIVRVTPFYIFLLYPLTGVQEKRTHPAQTGTTFDALVLKPNNTLPKPRLPDQIAKAIEHNWPTEAISVKHGIGEGLYGIMPAPEM